ncbi:MAG TPA: hypothetical protein DCZ95_12925 [Verrucomicrobia bacterium]|nr:MAG: hypothetical protein A2X46_11735 [Lentisphaerae bacterium GWF2_57_35]HBA84991.1 hypothetical protein [Verrucomicrobiota bacterium]
MNELPQFNVVDLAVLGFLLLGLVMGIRRGLSGELAGLIGAGASVWAGWYYYQPASQYLVEKTRLTGQAAQGVAFLGLLVGAWILMILLRLVLRHVMEFAFKGKIERIGGGLAGLLKTGVIASAVLLLLGMWPHAFLHRLFAEDSLFGRIAGRNLMPVYDELSVKYPILRLHEAEEESVAEEDAGEPPAADADAGFIRDEPE